MVEEKEKAPKRTRWEIAKEGLTLFAPICGLLGLALGLYNVTENLLVMGYPLLGMIIWVLLYLNLFFKKQKFPLEDIFEYPALIFYMAEKDYEADDEFHLYTSEKWTFKIDGDQSTWEVELKGINRYQEPSSYIPFKICGHTPIRVDEIDLKATDNKNSKTLYPRLISGGDRRYKKIYHIPFFRPLPLNEEFDISLSCKWSGHFTPKETYAFAAVYHYKKGIRKSTIVIESDKRIIGYGVRKFDRRWNRLFLTDEKCIEENNDKRLILEIENPKAHEVYLIVFEKE